MAKQILVIGAGRSSTSLIDYLLANASSEGWFITVGDVSKQTVLAKTKQHPLSRAIAFDVNNAQQRESEIDKADIVVSLLPASMHYNVAKDCVRLKKHMATASYVSKEIAGLDAAARKSGLILLNELGLDPGLDHMSAMKLINEIKNVAVENRVPLLAKLVNFNLPSVQETTEDSKLSRKILCGTCEF